jgi:hypothetical protein
VRILHRTLALTLIAVAISGAYRPATTAARDASGTAADASGTTPFTPKARLATASSPTGSLSFQPLLGIPASEVSLIGASPAEAEGEAWAQGVGGGGQTLLRYTANSGLWQDVPLTDNQGSPIAFQWWGSTVTPHGGVVLAGSAAAHPSEDQTVVVRDPGGAFSLVPPPTIMQPGSEAPGAVLHPGEELYPSGNPLIAALDEPGGHTGVLIAPNPPATEGEDEGPTILHYDGSSWSREPLCASVQADLCSAPPSSLTELALSASSAQNAWLLASTPTQPVILFQRQVAADGHATWVRRQPSGWLLGSGSAPLGGEKVTPASGGSLLTASGQGVWVDLQLSTPASSGDATAFLAGGASGELTGQWCFPTSLCEAGTPSLGGLLPGDYGSFAWPGSGPADPGERIITGLPNGALLRLPDPSENSASQAFSFTPGGGAGGGGAIGPGGVALAEVPGSRTARSGGAAFASPTDGWLGDPSSIPAMLHVTTHPSPSALRSWPVPFRHPLLAIAGQPGSTPGDPTAQALAVGAEGEVARYLPGQGWEPEYLYNSNGEHQAPNLRAVAWPEADRAYAVGDNGAMWVWQSATGLWEPDPAAPPGFRGQLTSIAFSASDPDVGYAVGKQGVLLTYGKSWSEEPLPPGLTQANFTSVAFAGGEAIATYRMLDPSEPTREIGGVIVNSGTGWQVDTSAQELFASLGTQSPVLSRVAGLPDGGAVAAGPGLVIERDSAVSPWRRATAPLPEADNIAALAAFREGSSVRALISVDDFDEDSPNGSLIYQGIDNPAGPALERYGLLLGPDPLPARGFLLRETAGGWQDQQNQAYPQLSGNDLPGWPDAVLALDVDPSGQQGWAVGGQTGGELALFGGQGAATPVQTAGVMRYGPGPEPPQSTDAQISLPAGQATFALGGNAQCASPCADLAADHLGPDAWLAASVSRANQITGLRAFLYTGGRIAAGDSGEEFERELSDYASLLHGGGPLPVYAAISPTDLYGGSSTAFSAALGASAPAGAAPAGSPSPPQGTAAYAFDSGGNGGTVRVIVLDDSHGALAPGDTTEPSCPSSWEEPSNQLQWLCSQLHYAAQAQVPAIVLGHQAPSAGPDASELEQVLLSQGASAYLFDSANANISTKLGTATNSIPVLGSGTLGYVPPNDGSQEYFGASGFLLASLDAAQRNPANNRAPVSATLIPNAGELGLEAADGTLLRRSQVALFQGLARRPAGGGEKITNSGDLIGEAPEAYTAVPETCHGPGCGAFLEPAYTFTSSNPDIGDFVEPDPSSTNPRAAFHGPGGKPVPDSSSGLFCAFNAGTTTVTVSSGGLSYSEPVTVQGGSVEQPCGTVPLLNPPRAEAQSVPLEPAPLPLSPSPSFKPSLSLTPPPPAPSTSQTHLRTPHALSAPFAVALLTPAPAPLPLHAAVPPPAPQTARPSPPSGTSQVTQPVGAAEREEKPEQATDVVHNMSAYHPGGNTPPPWSPLVIVLILAAAGGTLRRSRRQHRPVPAWVTHQAKAPPEWRSRPRRHVTPK